MKHYKAIIFDIDGTLIDSMPIWEDLDADFLKTQGRFSHLFKPENEKYIAIMQEEVDKRWEELLKKCEEQCIAIMPRRGSWQQDTSLDLKDGRARTARARKSSGTTRLFSCG